MARIIKFHRVPRLLAAVCLALTIGAPFAAAYVATSDPAALAETTSSQIDRSSKGDRLQVSPRQRFIESDGAQQIKAPTRVAGPRMLA
jgi:hypothetical protein